MNFRMLNVTINLPDGATADQAKALEASATAFIQSTGFAGTIGFDVMQDVPAPTPAPAAAATPEPAPAPAD